MGAAAAQLTVLRADLEAVEGQLRASQQEVALLRKTRMEEAAASAAEIRLVKVSPVTHIHNRDEHSDRSVFCQYFVNQGLCTLGFVR